MSTIASKDGAQIYYKDWGAGPVVTFSHGWPLNADAWDGQMHFLAQQGFRVASARKSARLIAGAQALYYPGAPHGLTVTHQDQVNADLLAFLRS